MGPDELPALAFEARRAAEASDRDRGGQAMEPDELQPIPKQPAPRNLDEMSIAALREYIAELEAEIARVRNAIQHKQAARSGAQQLFKR